MKQLTIEQITEKMRHIVWDYAIAPFELYDIVRNNKPTQGQFDRERILIRMLERLPWYDLLELLGMEYLKEHITPAIIKKLRFTDLQEKYELIRKVLHNEALPATGWSDENRQRIKHSLLSNRWYRTA